MSGLFETKLLKYKKHIIQVFEDMFGQRYVYIDGQTQTYSINNAKRMISLCCHSNIHGWRPEECGAIQRNGFLIGGVEGICRWPHRVGPTQQVAGNGS